MRRVVFAVDPLPVVVAEALDLGADLLITHHPLFLRPVHGVPATSWKGRVVHDLVRAGAGLLTAHTNADVAVDGVSDALAAALGLTDPQPLQAHPADPVDKLVTFVPPDHASAVVEALAGVGAGTIGDYTGCAWTSEGEGRFAHGATSQPTIGRPNVVDPGHWASEWPWLPRAAARLAEALAADGTTVETHVSTLVTDPVAGQVRSRFREDH